ncbi:hypothetical protein JAAARDRAFT_190873 [Jaapia argillacea MUCL 33604]|uniref:TOG domain-containing protein n=1 Tax=Jaapia argillacea MUCL 33604 TaxID=933084 RepID=A0A067Q3I5_9AGAM|nr:hypothetical protein JAAARDRAFT_190873 [Jaapia argillacea MUCL 33604]
MGIIVSLVDPRSLVQPILSSKAGAREEGRSTPPPRPASPSPLSQRNIQASRTVLSPSAMYPMASSSSSLLDDPYEARHPSPSYAYLSPSSPLHEGSPLPPFSSSPPLDTASSGPPSFIQTEAVDALGASHDALDLSFDDDSLSTLEKIYLFSQSKASFHRVYIAHTLVSFLPEVDPAEAVEYVLPLLTALVIDEAEDSVKEALATELVHIMWWFFTNCRLYLEVEGEEPPDTEDPLIPVAAFTPILGTLLLSPNGKIGGPARAAVVEMLVKMHKARGNDEDAGLFGKDEMLLFERELLYQVIIGMSRLDLDGEDGFGEDDGSDEDDGRPEVWWTAPSTPADPNLFPATPDVSFNPYFPALPTVPEEPGQLTSSTPSPPITSTETPSQVRPSPSSALPKAPAPSPSSFSTSSSGQSSLEATPELSPATQTSPSSSTPRLSPVSPPSPPEPLSPPFQPRLPDPIIRGRDPILDQEQPASGQPWHIENPVSRVVLEEYTPELSRRTPEVETPPLHPTSVFESDPEEPEHDTGEQAALGRLSSMSLMAAVAASGTLDEETQVAFVREVDRVGRDATYWVRREASFAVGALAKVVPFEIVISSLLPLFDSLRQDLVWQVRHSALFALPALLSRLSPQERQNLALKTLLPLSMDLSPQVRSGVLEALGEVIHSFHEDTEGPPAELIGLFLGRRESDVRHRWREGQKVILNGHITSKSKWTETLTTSALTHVEDPNRPLICAFNYPAVVLTLGKGRWDELRDEYLSLARNPAPRVRKTMAASVGEIAKIIGPENAKRDLMGVWLNAVKSEEWEERMKAIECLEVFIGALGKDEQSTVLDGLQAAWKAGLLKGWREREVATKSLQSLVGLVKDQPSRLTALLDLALQDDVAAVRMAAVNLISLFLTSFSEIRDKLAADIRMLATSSSFRKRNTFVACQEALVRSPAGAKIVLEDGFWEMIIILSTDSITDVRIAVARLVSLVRDRFFTSSLPPPVQHLIKGFRLDTSREVRAFFPLVNVINLTSDMPSSPTAIFSRPPPCRPD